MQTQQYNVICWLGPFINDWIESCNKSGVIMVTWKHETVKLLKRVRLNGMQKFPNQNGFACVYSELCQYESLEPTYITLICWSKSVLVKCVSWKDCLLLSSCIHGGMCEVTLMTIPACGMDRALSIQPPTPLLTPIHRSRRQETSGAATGDWVGRGPVVTLVILDTAVLVTTNQLLLVSGKQSVNAKTT